MTTHQRILSIARTGLLWLATAYLAIIFARAGTQKFSSDSGWAHAFADWGFPVWFRILVGAVELAGAALVLIPRTAAYGAAAIILVMLGAMGTHAWHGHPEQATHEIVPLTMALIVAIARWRARARRVAVASTVAATVLFLCVPVEGRAQSATFASLNGPTGLGVQRFDIERGHSSVEFSVRFMGLSTVRGAFTDYHGTIMYDPKNITNSSVSVVFETRRINSNNENRDRDLRSANFFDVEKYPLMLFHSERIVRTKAGFVAHGPLTMHGVTRSVAISFVQTHGIMSDAWGNKRIGFVGHLTLNRKDYGVLGTKFWNAEFDPGRMSVADKVDIDLNIEAEVNQVDRWTLPISDSILALIPSRGLEPVLAEFRSAAKDSSSFAAKNLNGILNGVAAKLMHHGKYADAADVYRVAVDLSREPSWAYAGLGEAVLMSGIAGRELAIESFQKAAQLDSTNTVASEYLRHLQRR